jgi:hypothetical protein
LRENAARVEYQKARNTAAGSIDSTRNATFPSRRRRSRLYDEPLSRARLVPTKKVSITTLCILPTCLSSRSRTNPVVHTQHFFVCTYSSVPLTKQRKEKENNSSEEISSRRWARGTRRPAPSRRGLLSQP